MWYLGLAVGLVLGAAFGSWPAALFLGAIGAAAAQRWIKSAPKPKSAVTAESGWPDPPSTSAANETSALTLRQRIAALEARVQALEAAASAASTASAGSVASPLIESTPRADVVEAAEPAARAGDLPPIAPQTITAPAIAAAAGEAAAHLAAEWPEPEAIAASSTATPVPIDPWPAEAWPDPTPAPPKPPAIPLRDRLPAPIANLIFGGNMLVKLGVLILFLGLAFLLRYTAERVTVPVELRYAGVALAGAALLALGWVLRTRRTAYALTLQGAGIGTFYLTTLAAMKLSALLPAGVGFAFLFAVAVLAALLAVLQNAPVLAIVAALEGFAAPVLASTGENRPLALFTYLLVLDVGIFLVAWFKAWRVLNLIGFVGTFTLAAGWAHRFYDPGQYGIVQPFLIAFFVLFTLIGLLFARRTLFDAPGDAAAPLGARAVDTLKRVGRVDSSLVFGVPMVAFGLQYLLMRPWEFGAAFSALALGLIYLALGRFVQSTQPRGLALLAEAYAIVGVIFGTLAIPLGLEGQWTGATWAVEAAGMYWLGVRQQRPYARAFALLLVAGAVVQMLRAITLNDAPGSPALNGSVIGPLMLAAGVFAIWAQHRRAALDAGNGWEAIAGSALPWLAMAALTLLPWQLLTPMWAATATALLALATFAVALRWGWLPLKSVACAMQVFAVLALIATLRPGGEGQTALTGGAHAGLAASLVALSVLAIAGWAMRGAHRAALATGIAPRWTIAQVAGSVGGVALLHLAMLLGADLPHAALIWSISALVVIWVALRIAHPALAMLAAVLHGAAALIFVIGLAGDDPRPHAAFAHLGFWTPLALGLTALVAADWLRGEAAHARTASGETPMRRWVNAWCGRPAALWGSLSWGLGWWFAAVLGEGTRVLWVHDRTAFEPTLIVGTVLFSSLLASAVAARRDWRQLGQATIATLPGFIVAALVGGAIHASTEGGYLPSSAWGWLAWPLALAWHLRLLYGPRRWVGDKVLSIAHVAGLWFFVLLAARECLLRFEAFGEGVQSWPLLGWVLVPVLVLWGLRARAALRRWPLSEYRGAYLEIGAAPIAAYLLGWVWLTNMLSAGDAAPLPYLPLLNPLELAHGLVLASLLLWWRALPPASRMRVPMPVALGLAAATGLALLTGMVLRSCHHFAGVPWELEALFASRLAQAALSIAWALCGVAAMVLGHRRRSRGVWIAGASLLGVVVVKLFLIELADQGGLFRIVSFVGVGVLLLVVGYFAPVPPAAPGARDEGQPA